jgi:BolA protein
VEPAAGAWIIFFGAIGALNLFVAFVLYKGDMAAWVSFKAFGATGIFFCLHRGANPVPGQTYQGRRMMHTDNTATGNTSPATRMERIRTRLETALSPLECVLEDDSARHRGHAGAASGGGHYNLRIVSSQFEGLRLVMRHRLVYDSVHDMMHNEIHALAIVALAPSEVA